jgi:hypothetical protein
MSATPEDTYRRRWRLFLAIEALLVLVASASTWAVLAFRLAAAWWFVSLLWVWLVFSLPVAFLRLIGRPPVMSLSPLVSSPEVRAFRRELQARPALSDAEFHARFYAGSGTPRDIPARVRRCLSEFDRLADRVVPDDLLLFNDELDFTHVLDRVGGEFGVRFTAQDYALADGTLDNLVRMIHARLGWPVP